MLSNELTDLVEDICNKQCEMQNIEIKKAFDGCPKKLYNTISSFANQNGGGIIIFGIDEKESFDICGVYDAQDLQKKITEQCNQMEPVVRPLFTVSEVNGKIVVSAEIAECGTFDKPCFYKGAGRMKGSYIRVGDADMLMTEYEIYSFEVFRRKIQDELRVVGRADIDTLDQNKLIEYFAKLKIEKPNLSNMSNEQIMQLQGITDKQKPTVAGIMLFGIYPQSFFPQLSITALAVPGNAIGTMGENEERFLDNRRIEGTLPQIYEQAIGFIFRNTKTKTIIDNQGNRKDVNQYPMKAVREIILNALMHRDYSIHTDTSPTRLIIYSDRMEIENPGGLYGRLTLDDLGNVGADTRNPFLAGMLEVMGVAENRFSGIPTIYHEMKKAGLPKPIFTVGRGSFKVTLLNKTNDSINRYTNNSEIRGIIEFCHSPRTREELAAFLNISTPSYAMKNYVLPLVDAGLIKMTIPNKPKSKYQMYVKV